MQVSPSASLFQALSTINQSGGARASGAEFAAGTQASAQQSANLNSPEAVQPVSTTSGFAPAVDDLPPPGTDLPRGSLVDVQA